MEPVRGLVADALEAVSLHKGLHHVDGMAVLIDPVLPDTPHDPAKDMAGQMRHTHPGQDEEACIIGHEVDVVFSCCRLPPNKGVARSDCPGGGTEEEAGNRVTGAILHQILDIFTDRSVEPEVVMLV